MIGVAIFLAVLQIAYKHEIIQKSDEKLSNEPGKLHGIHNVNLYLV